MRCNRKFVQRVQVSFGGLRRDREADKQTDAFALKGILSTLEKAQLETLTVAFTSAVLSAQIVPPQNIPGILASVRGSRGKSNQMLTIRRVFDVCTLDYPAIGGEQSGADAEF
jgi:hypothetical protein